MKDLKIKKLTPLNDDVLVTAEKYKSNKDPNKVNLIKDIKEMDGRTKLYQKVLAVGPVVRNINVGDLVAIDPKRFIIPEHQEDVDSLREIIKIRNTYTNVQFPIIHVDGEECMLISQRDIKFKFTIDEQ